MIPIEYLLLIGSFLIIVSIIVARLSENLGMPVLLLFLGIGMLAGSEGPGGIYFDNANLAQSVGVIALVFILFAGGLDTKWSDVAPVFRPAAILATLGVFLTALLVGLFAFFVLKLSLTTSLLLGAVVSSTDAAAVFAVLRSKKISLRGQLKPLLELESGSNDPMAVLLTIGIIQVVVNPETTFGSILFLFALQMGIGAVLGLVLGKLMILMLNRLKSYYEGVYPVLSLALALLTYGVTASVGGSGFLAVYIAGLRGAVPVVLATFPLVAGVSDADIIFNIVFFIVITSALLQGWSIPIVARLLKLQAPLIPKRQYPIEYAPLAGVDTELVEFIVPYSSGIAGKPIVELGLPRDSLIVLVNRDQGFFVPRGGTTLEGGDVVLVLGSQKDLAKAGEILTRWKKPDENNTTGTE